MSVLIVVRRGGTERLAFLKETFAAEPVEIRWDRRVADRRRWDVLKPRTERRSGERRRGERRRSPPASWTALDYVVSSRSS